MNTEIEELREALDWTVRQNEELLNEGRELTARAERLRMEAEQMTNMARMQAARADAAEREARHHKTRAERLEKVLLGLRDLMLEQAKWEPCDCGCPQQRKPDGPHSVTWLRAAQQVEIAISKARDATPTPHR